jgi:hypothetical protein
VRNGEGRNRYDAIKAAGGHGPLEQRLHKIYSATPSKALSRNNLVNSWSASSRMTALVSLNVFPIRFGRPPCPARLAPHQLTRLFLDSA